MQGRVRLSLDEGVSWTFTGGVWLSQIVANFLSLKEMSQTLWGCFWLWLLWGKTCLLIIIEFIHLHFIIIYFKGWKTIDRPKCNKSCKGWHKLWFWNSFTSINFYILTSLIILFTAFLNSFIITYYYFIITFKSTELHHSNSIPIRVGASVSHVS